jgi:hypothetical protein
MEYGDPWEVARVYHPVCLHSAMDADLRPQIKVRIATALVV